MRKMLVFIAGVAALSLCAAKADSADAMSLAGTWRFRLDPDNAGVAKQWFKETLDDSVTLPGTTDTNFKGVVKDEKAIDRLSRVWYWKGPAWYQREVEIPDTWKGKRITLSLERTKNTRVWVDERDCGGEDTLSASHVFDLTPALTPGRHVITVLVDNAKLPPVGPAHAVDPVPIDHPPTVGRVPDPDLLPGDIWVHLLREHPGAHDPAELRPDQ